MKTHKCPACFQPENALKNIQKLVDEQANDRGLWFVATVHKRDDGVEITVPVSSSESYLQNALRKLHARIEDFSQ